MRNGRSRRRGDDTIGLRHLFDTGKNKKCLFATSVDNSGRLKLPLKLAFQHLYSGMAGVIFIEENGDGSDHGP